MWPPRNAEPQRCASSIVTSIGLPRARAPPRGGGPHSTKGRPPCLLWEEPIFGSVVLFSV